MSFASSSVDKLSAAAAEKETAVLKAETAFNTKVREYLYSNYGVEGPADFMKKIAAQRTPFDDTEKEKVFSKLMARFDTQEMKAEEAGNQYHWVSLDFPEHSKTRDRYILKVVVDSTASSCASTIKYEAYIEITKNAFIFPDRGNDQKIREIDIPCS